MRIIDAGHIYELDYLDNENSLYKDKSNILRFVKREGKNFPFNNNHHPGTNCQEVLRALIDRSEYLNKQQQCAETEAIVGLLKSALLLFELRAARCHDRHIDLPNIQPLIAGPTCPKCKHYGCKQHLQI